MADVRYYDADRVDAYLRSLRTGFQEAINRVLSEAPHHVVLQGLKDNDQLVQKIQQALFVVEVFVEKADPPTGESETDTP